MAALSDLLDSLAKPNPTFHDVDDEFGDNTTAQLSIHGTEDDVKDGEQIQKSTKLKRQAASLLSDTDARYAGQKTTRKELMQDSEKGSTGDGEDDLSSHEDEEEEEDDGDEDDDNGNDEDIASFRQLIQKKSLESNGLKQSSEIDDDDAMAEDIDGDGSDDDDDAMAEDIDGDGSDDDDAMVEDIDGDGSDDDVDDGSDASGDGESDEDAESKVATGHKESMDMEDPGVNLLKQLPGMSSDKQKGLAVQTQLGFLDNLLEGRIKLQRAVSLINQIPQPSTWNHFMALGKDKYTSAVHTVQNQLCHLLNTLIHLQTSLLLKDTQTRHIVTGEEMSKDGDNRNNDDDDEEIPSDDEEEVTTNSQPSATVDYNVKKRKLLPPQIRGFLAKRARKFETCRDAVIQKWDTKTRLASGKLNKKSFSALEQSALKQIEQVLYDKERLIKRTQIQRSSYKIYGQPEKEESIMDDKDDAVANNKEQDKNTREAEIFDDTDFYHLLLQDFIRRKSTSDNASSVNRQYQEIQQLRDKKKRKVDPRASKGRKLRYDVHKKLVNFMGPIDQSSWTDEARDELYRSLFGQYHQNDQ